MPDPNSSTNPYENPALTCGSIPDAGVPAWTDPAETPAERAGRSPFGERVDEGFALAGVTMPGLALLALLAVVATSGARNFGVAVLGFERSPVSPILVAILLGLAIRNTIGMPGVYEAGVRLGLKRVLRLGVALLGLQLSLSAAGRIGLVALPIVRRLHRLRARARPASIGRALRAAAPPRDTDRRRHCDLRQHRDRRDRPGDRGATTTRPATRSAASPSSG